MVRPASSAAALLGAVVLAGFCHGTAARQTSSFDSNWRFQLGDAGYGHPLCNSSDFSTNMSGTSCPSSTMMFVSSRELCEAACCGNPRCTFWQWCEQPCVPASPGWGCRNGYDSCPGKKAAINWTSMVRATPPMCVFTDER
jgi:hypothetical protein